MALTLSVLSSVKASTVGVMSTLVLYPIMSKDPVTQELKLIIENGMVQAQPIRGGRRPSVYQAFFVPEKLWADKARIRTDSNGISFTTVTISGLGHVSTLQDESGKPLAWCEVKSMVDATPANAKASAPVATGAAAIELPTF